MPCAAGDLCQLPNEELIAPNGHECGHECRGGCGGRLHGLCGELEDGSDTPTHRICHTCISKRSPSNSAKRKEGQGFLQPDARSVRVSTMSAVSTLRAQAKASKMVAGTMGLAEGHPAHILDAAELMQAAWADVTPATIAR